MTAPTAASTAAVATAAAAATADATTPAALPASAATAAAAAAAAFSTHGARQVAHGQDAVLPPGVHLARDGAAHAAVRPQDWPRGLAGADVLEHVRGALAHLVPLSLVRTGGGVTLAAPEAVQERERVIAGAL